MEYASRGLPTKLNGIQLLQEMAAQGSLGKIKSYIAWSSSLKVRQINTTNCDRRRQSVGQDRPKKGDVYGFDGCKKVKGRKRQTLVDSLGLLLKVVVSEANAPERVLAAYALMELLEERPELLEKVKVMWVDSGYDGDKFALCVWLMIQAHVEVIRRTEQEFQVLPKRWVVERTFGWFNQYHRLSKDYERLTEMSEAAIYAVMTRIMLRRLVS